MKRIFFLCMFSITVLQATVFAQTSDPGLLSALSSYNQNTQYARSGCSGFWSCLLHVVAVVGADITGAAAGVQAVSGAAGAVGLATGGTGVVVVSLIGGVTAGAGASYATNHGLSNRSIGSQIMKESVVLGNLTIQLPRQFRNLSSMGIDHNTVIHNNFFGGAPINEFYQGRLDQEQINVLNSYEVVQAFADINDLSSEYANNNFDFRTLTRGLLQKHLISSNCKDVLDLFLEKYTTIADKADIERIVNFYVSAVAASALSELDKRALLAAFMVASESPFYLLQPSMIR